MIYTLLWGFDGRLSNGHLMGKERWGYAGSILGRGKILLGGFLNKSSSILDWHFS